MAKRKPNKTEEAPQQPQEVKAEVQKNEVSDETEDDAKYRIYSVLSYFVVLIVIGLPVWWLTTRVYRASLPLEEMFNVKVPPKIIRENSIPLSLEYDILITMVNPDPKGLTVELNGYDIDSNLQPFIKSLGGLATFTVKSQWLYLVSLNTIPGKLQDSFSVLEERLPYVITPLEMKTWSHMSSRPTLNLVVYVTSCNKNPLQIFDKNKKKVESNSFLSPRWGGIQILNPSKEDCEKGTYKPDLKRIVSISLIQLKQLIGLHGSTALDVNDLKKTKTKEMLESTRRTLKSLAQLLSEISSIVISDEVAEKIKKAMAAADVAEEHLKKGSIEEAIFYAKIAFENSEKAFSDPSLLALLYFPDDQKYAVYIPLFLPIMIPVLMSLTTIRRWYVGLKEKKKTD